MQFDGAAGLFVSDHPDAKAEALLDGLQARGVRSVFVRYLRTLNGHPSADAVLAAVSHDAGVGAVDAQAHLAC